MRANPLENLVPNLASLARSLRGLGLTRAALDSVGGASRPALDDAGIGSAAATYAAQSIRMQAAAAVQTWCDSEVPMGPGEGVAARLDALLVSVADADQTGDLDDAEMAVYGQAREAAWGYLLAKGVAEEDLDALFNSDDPEVADAAGDRVMGFVVDALPDGDVAAQTDMDDWAFGDAEAVAPVFDAAYKAQVAVRGGKKTVVKKRISGSVQLSAAQRMAVKKMQAKAHGAQAQMARAKSLRARKAAGK